MRAAPAWWLALGLVTAAGCAVPDAIRVDRDVAIPMRDGTVLRGDVYRPARGDAFPVLVFRTPYGKHRAAESDGVHRKAVARGYAVVMQDVRGRYASAGIFAPYRQEGADGYDTIEWAARQPWSNGRVGTWGLSYPGAVQWLAALEQPPHLVSMAPAMTFSSPRRFFYMNGIFDRSWLPWIVENVAPDARRRLGLPQDDGRHSQWSAVADDYLSWLPLAELPWLRQEAPYYFEWLRHPPEDPWWDWAELRGRYGRVSAAVLNLSGWYDDAYGVEGAATNFSGLEEARRGDGALRAHLVLGPWVHGDPSRSGGRAGDLDFGPAGAIDYDGLVLDFHDYYLGGVDNQFAAGAPVRYFVMGANEWREADDWPSGDSRDVTLYLAQSAGENGDRRLLSARPAGSGSRSKFTADPRRPVTDPYDGPGAHDYRALAARPDVLTFDSEPVSQELWIAGEVTALIHASCDCRDFDLWVRLQDVHPDGSAFNLMAPGNDVVRASYRDPSAGSRPLEPGRVYELRLDSMMTGIRLGQGHRLRVQVSASFDPHLSRNLQTGESEVESSVSRTATIAVHHDARHSSSLTIPALPAPGADPAAAGWCDPGIAAQSAAAGKGDDWFTVREVAPGVHAISETRQFEGVSSFLVLGSERALLFDTGLGVVPIEPVVRGLTSLPVTVLNSHTHFDHAGGNREFSDVRNLDDPYSRASARGEIPEPLRAYAQATLDEENLCGPLPAGVASRDYAIPRWRIAAPVRDGERFDLGGRTLETVVTPGHTPDSLCLLDRANGLLFTGDTYYSGEIYLWAPETNVADYTASVARLAGMVRELKRLLPAHGSPVAEPQRLTELQEALGNIATGRARAESAPEGRRQYRFEHFSIQVAGD